MTLNTAQKIEKTFDIVAIIILLPFALVIQVLEWLVNSPPPEGGGLLA